MYSLFVCLPENKNKQETNECTTTNQTYKLHTYRSVRKLRTHLVVVDRVGYPEVNAAGAEGRHGILLGPGQQRPPEILPGAMARAAYPHLFLAAAPPTVRRN